VSTCQHPGCTEPVDRRRDVIVYSSHVNCSHPGCAEPVRREPCGPKSASGISTPTEFV